VIVNDNAITEHDAAMYSPLTLAYLGDSVYELLVREKLVLVANKSNGKLHSEATVYVSAKGQSAAIDKIIDVLTESELAVYKRGRNSNAVPGKNADVGEYKRATGLEALFGYLYLIGATERIEELFDIITKEE